MYKTLFKKMGYLPCQLVTAKFYEPSTLRCKVKLPKIHRSISYLFFNMAYHLFIWVTQGEKRGEKERTTAFHWELDSRTCIVKGSGKPNLSFAKHQGAGSRSNQPLDFPQFVYTQCVIGKTNATRKTPSFLVHAKGCFQKLVINRTL